MRYDPIMCMMVDDSVKTQDELSLSQKKQVVTELKGFLKKSYNFSDESEYARAYEDLRYMFTTGSRKSISGLFENAVKKTGSHDSVKTKDANKNEGYKIHKAEIRGDKLYLTYTDLLYGGKETESFTKSEAKGFLTDPWNTWEGNTKSVMMKFVKDSNTIDKAIRMADGMFSSIFGKYSSAAKQHLDRAVNELDSFKGEVNDYLNIAGKWEKQLRNDLARIDEAYAVAGEDYNAARREIRADLDSLTQTMLRKAREKKK